MIYKKLFMILLSSFLLFMCHTEIQVIQNCKEPKILKEYLQSEDSWKREEALKAVALMREQILLEDVVALLSDNCWWVRAEAVTTLGKLESYKYIHLIVDVANKDNNENVRIRAVESLGYIGDNTLLEALRVISENDPSYLVRFAAIAAIETIKLKGSSLRK